jgi:hypothetical protein
VRSRSSTRLGLAAALAAVAACIFSPAATTASYTIVAGGSPVTVIVSPSGTTSNATFSGTAGQRISLNFSSDTIQSAKVSILKPGGANLVTPFQVTRSGYWFDVHTLPLTGTYKILVDPNLTYTGHVVLTLYDVPADPTGPITADGTPATVTTTTPGQNGTLTFTGTANQRVSVSLTGVTYSAAKLRILEPDSSLLYPTALAFSPGGGFLEPKTLPSNGTYTIVVDPTLRAVGQATVQLYTVPADQTGPVLTDGTTATATTATPGQNAYLTFNGTANQRVSVILTNSTYGTARVSLLKPDGTALFSPAVTVAGTDAFVDTKTLPTTGQYKVFVDPQGADVGSLDVKLYDVPADVTGAIATNGTTTTAATAVPGQNALYTFSGTLNQRVSIELPAGATYDSAKVSILKPDGTLLFSPALVASPPLAAFHEPVTLPVTGTYKVKVDPQGASVGQLDVKLWIVTPDVTGALANGVAKVVNIASAGQGAHLTYAGTAGQRIALNLTGVTLGSSACCGAKIRVLRPDGTTLVAWTTFGTDGKFIDTKALNLTGSYKVDIDPVGPATGSLNVTLYVVPADAAVTSGALTSGGTSVSVTTTVLGQNGVVSFAGTAGQRFAFELVSFSAGFCDVKLSVLKPDATTLTFPICSTNGDWFETKTLPATGTYKVKVDPQGTSTGTASLKLYGVPADVNTALAGSASLSPGQNGSYTFTVTGGPKTATITPTAGGTINLVAARLQSADGSVDYDVQFWDTSGGTAVSGSLPNGNYRLFLDPVGDAGGSISFGLVLT